MKYYVVRANDNPSAFVIVGASGFEPSDFVCLAPKDANGNWVTDSDIVSVRDKQTVLGETIKEAFVDQAKVAAKQANAVIDGLKALILVKYNEMNEQVLVQMYNVFGTTNPDSASAYKQTWELMKEKPALFRDEGLLVERQILAADGMTILFQAGAALNDDFSVVTYATRLIQMAEEYAVYRMKRIQQFRDDRALILAQ